MPYCWNGLGNFACRVWQTAGPRKSVGSTTLLCTLPKKNTACSTCWRAETPALSCSWNAAAEPPRRPARLWPLAAPGPPPPLLPLPACPCSKQLLHSGHQLPAQTGSSASGLGLLPLSPQTFGGRPQHGAAPPPWVPAAAVVLPTALPPPWLGPAAAQRLATDGWGGQRWQC